MKGTILARESGVHLYPIQKGVYMSIEGGLPDNVVSESFFHSLKTELAHHERFKARAEANQAIFECIEVFYNRQRLHSTNDYRFPVNYELKMLEYQTAA